MKYFAIGLVCGALAAAAGAAEKPVTLGVECEDFQFLGDWNSGYSPAHFSGKGMLSNGELGAKLPAVTGVTLPRAGRYALWARAADYPNDRPGTRLFKVSAGGKLTQETFGDSGRPSFSWEPGGVFELPAGPVLLGIHDIGKKFARADALLLTTDLNFKPTAALGTLHHPRVKPLALPMPGAADPFAAAPVTTSGELGSAALENEHLRLEFLPAQRDGRPTVAPRVAFKQDGRWVDVGADADAETYAVVASGKTELKFTGFYPSWQGGVVHPFKVRAGGVELETRTGSGMAVWDAGEALRFVPRSATRAGNTVRLDFHPQPAGKLAATWELKPGERTARVALEFVPAQAGAYALGYHLFCRKPLAEVEEVLLPMMWHGKRFPSQPVTLLQTHTPTPVALMQLPGARVLGVSGSPEEIPFAWPDRQHPLFGLLLRSASGAVQPAIYGPIPGTARARCAAGASLRFAFRVLAQDGDWYAGYRTAADEIFGWRDYRSNVGTSLTDAALNMIDLFMDDNFGGWWKRGKGPYQIETLNGVTHSSPLTALELYRLTGNEELYRRRTLPTLEYALSRSNPHFSPEPAHTGVMYPAGSLGGPISIYGTTAYGGLWELTHRRTPAFGAVALPTNGVKPTAGYGHGQEFEEWLARHLLTGDAAALAKARELADLYLEKNIRTPPAGELTPQPFFNVSFVPDWEGLLRMWEVTGEKKYLEGAALGARRLMTSVWTQPVVPAGEMTVHPGGAHTASSPKTSWWKGPDQFRLGFPRKPGDAPEHRAPSWIPSNVGLGFEQPCTYSRMDSGGAMIYQSAWAPNFLRLAAATGDKQFETYARNATLGRWGNYPGYYVVGFTDLPLDPRYPYQGPDVSCIYYHHILPHLAWTIDWLVAEAALRSGGKISFPSQRQHGYVWFDSREYGAAPGKVLAVKDAWLWFDRGVARLDNPAINHLLAHTADQLCVVLMNENSTPEKVGVEFLPAKLGLAAGTEPQLTATTAAGTAVPVQFDKLHAALEVPARGLVVLTLAGVNVKIAAHETAPPLEKTAPPAIVAVPTSLKDIEVRAAAVQIRPGPWDAYVWCTAKPDRVKKVVFHYQLGGAWKQVEDAEYPFELSIPVPDPAQDLRFRAEITGADGQTSSTPEATLAAPR
jgi:hypothetical protein